MQLIHTCKHPRNPLGLSNEATYVRTLCTATALPPKLHIYVHQDTCNNVQAALFIRSRMDNSNCPVQYNGKLLNDENEQTFSTYNKMDESQNKMFNREFRHKRVHTYIMFTKGL